MEFAVIHSNESARRHHLQSFLQKAICQPLRTIRNSDNTTADFQMVSRCGELSPHLIFGEENEFGEGGSDPSVQAAFSFLRAYRQKENNELRFRCCFPSFLIGHAGPWLTIMGGIVTTECVVQRLTDFVWVPVHSSLDEEILRIARILYALRESVERLDRWYKSIEDIPPCKLDPVPHPRFFPSPNSFRYNNDLVKFSYQRPLERSISCDTYLAKTVGHKPRDIVVMFVTSYGGDAHRCLASAGFAPELLYHGPINVTEDMPSYGSLQMVVMEYAEGITYDKAIYIDNVPKGFKADLQQVLEHLHKAGYVFGDLRPPNVLVTPRRMSTAQLIDFDWAGKQGEARYPISISRSIEWPEGVEGLEYIQQQHDLDMLRSLMSLA